MNILILNAHLDDNHIENHQNLKTQKKYLGFSKQ